MVIGYWDTENLSESSSLLILLQYPMAKEISALPGGRKSPALDSARKHSSSSQRKRRHLIFTSAAESPYGLWAGPGFRKMIEDHNAMIEKFPHRVQKGYQREYRESEHGFDPEK